MQVPLPYYRSAIVVIAMAATVFVLVRCTNNSPQVPTGSNKGFDAYSTDEKCAACHQQIYDNHLATAHYLTGQPALEKFIKGSFQKGKNNYSYTPYILLSMQKRDSGLFQVAYFKGEEKKAMKFDIVTGSGVMGQSFLTWRGNKLYQLPVTYFTAANQWSNSPGFPEKKVMIDRPVTSRCVECHITYAEGISGTPLEPDAFSRAHIIYAVGCQKCHGPAAKHVEYQANHPQDKMAKFIVNPGKLSRELQMDICALCHGGNIQKTKPSFQFLPGEKLTDYFVVDTLMDITLNSSAVDVHGNQVGLLKASKCYRLSSDMTCGTCHDTHNNERGQTELFSERCQKCHQVEAASFKTPAHTSATAIEKNCIDCHMPAQPSKSIAVFLQGEDVPKASSLRSHFIGIYPSQIIKGKIKE